MEPHEVFARNLRRQRGRSKLSQEALGFEAGLHPSEISRLECAEREPRLSTIVRLSRGLDVRVSVLLRGIE